MVPPPPPPPGDTTASVSWSISFSQYPGITRCKNCNAQQAHARRRGTHHPTFRRHAPEEVWHGSRDRGDAAAVNPQQTSANTCKAVPAGQAQPVKRSAGRPPAGHKHAPIRLVVWCRDVHGRRRPCGTCRHIALTTSEGQDMHWGAKGMTLRQ